MYNNSKLSQSFLLLTVGAIFCTGLVVIFSTTSAEVIDLELPVNAHHALVRQVIYAGAGLFLAFCVSRIGYDTILRISPLLLTLFSIFLLLTLIPGIGREVNGSRRWLGFAGLYFQPSEFVKIIVPAFFIYRFLGVQGEKISLSFFLRVVGIAFIPILLILIEPNNGTAAVIAFSLVVLCFLLRVRFKFWAFPLVALVLVGGTFASQLPYVTARIKVYLNPELDIKGKGHQPYQAKIAAGSGQLFGKGPGKSWQKLSYLPEAQNDYIAAIFAEEYGFLGVSVLISLYLILACLGFSIASNAQDAGGFYLAAMVTYVITFQAFLNLGVVSGLLPSTGLNLPFFSQGGTSVMANLIGIGILWSISTSKYNCVEEKTYN